MVKLNEGEKIAFQGNFGLGFWWHFIYLFGTVSALFPAIFWYLAYRQASGGELVITNKRIIGAALKGKFTVSLVDVDIPLEEIMKVDHGSGPQRLIIKTLMGQSYTFAWIDDAKEAANILKIKVSESH